MLYIVFHQNAYMVIPCVVFVVDNGSPKTPGWVNTSSCDGDGGQMNQEHRKPNGKWSQNLQISKNTTSEQQDMGKENSSKNYWFDALFDLCFELVKWSFSV